MICFGFNGIRTCVFQNGIFGTDRVFLHFVDPENQKKMRIKISASSMDEKTKNERGNASMLLPPNVYRNETKHNKEMKIWKMSAKRKVDFRERER